jgi:hypothetical protein
MIARCILGLVFLFLPVSTLSAQSVADQILARYGGAAAISQLGRFEVTGHFEGTKAAEAFTLRASGERSRFETADFREVRDGSIGQSGPSDRALPAPRRRILGSDDRLILPTSLLSRLASFRYAGLEQGKYWFETEIDKKEFIGYDEPPVQVELTFDATTLLLQSVRFTDPSHGTDFALTYEEYTLVGKVPVATRIVRWMNEKPIHALRIETVNFSPSFNDDDLSLVEEGGR